MSAASVVTMQKSDYANYVSYMLQSSILNGKPSFKKNDSLLFAFNKFNALRMQLLEHLMLLCDNDHIVQECMSNWDFDLKRVDCADQIEFLKHIHLFAHIGIYCIVYAEQEHKDSAVEDFSVVIKNVVDFSWPTFYDTYCDLYETTTSTAVA